MNKKEKKFSISLVINIPKLNLCFCLNDYKKVEEITLESTNLKLRNIFYENNISHEKSNELNYSLFFGKLNFAFFYSENNTFNILSKRKAFKDICNQKTQIDEIKIENEDKNIINKNQVEIINDKNGYKININQNEINIRIDAFIMRHNSKGYDDFVALVKRDKALLEEFVEYITINVSEFYRNPEQWKFLTEEVFPKLIERFGNRLTIWSAACSTGDEPYSLVMALSKYVPLSQIKVIATDLSDEIIEKAKIGMYGHKSVTSVPPEYKEKYFKKNGDFYQISDEIKRCVEFKKHNLICWISSTWNIRKKNN